MATEDTITFSCRKGLYGKIPEPQPASEFIPEWYKGLEFSYDEDRQGRNVKWCMSFLDAMTKGWIVPVPYDVQVISEPGEQKIAMECKDPEMSIDSHSPEQLGDENNPMLPLPIIKFNTPWWVETPKGVSVLVTKPLNRHEPRFQPFSGVIDSDNKRLRINAPSLWTDMGFEGTVEKGTPLVQVIPYTRDGTMPRGKLRQMGEGEMKEEELIMQSVTSTGNVYRENWWTPKEGERIVEREEPE